MVDKYHLVDREPAADDPPLLMRGTVDDWGKPRVAIRGGEDLMTEADGKVTRRALISAQLNAVAREQAMGPTESVAAFFDELDKLGAGGRVISRGKVVGFLGPAGHGYIKRNRG